ncbi:MAG: PQ-loop repeat-containing protein [Patescibacteria group bacterium]|nr:PQ-loop repeat-containing protein [Patescibacteria group bacterium]
MELSAIFGWTATVLFSICYIPQMIKTHQTKTVEGLSFLLLFISLIANIVALIYALLIHQNPLQIKYGLALIFLTATMVVYVKIWRTESKTKEVIPLNNE